MCDNLFFIIFFSLFFISAPFILHGIYLPGPDYMLLQCNGSRYKEVATNTQLQRQQSWKEQLSL